MLKDLLCLVMRPLKQEVDTPARMPGPGTEQRISKRTLALPEDIQRCGRGAFASALEKPISPILLYFIFCFLLIFFLYPSNFKPGNLAQPLISYILYVESNLVNFLLSENVSHSACYLVIL